MIDALVLRSSLPEAVVARVVCLHEEVQDSVHAALTSLYEDAAASEDTLRFTAVYNSQLGHMELRKYTPKKNSPVWSLGRDLGSGYAVNWTAKVVKGPSAARQLQKLCVRLPTPSCSHCTTI